MGLEILCDLCLVEVYCDGEGYFGNSPKPMVPICVHMKQALGPIPRDKPLAVPGCSCLFLLLPKLKLALRYLFSR